MFAFIYKTWETVVQWYGRTVVIGASAVIILLIGGGVFFGSTPEVQEESDSETRPTEVIVTSVAALASAEAQNISLLGSVEAKNQATLVAESGGRVTSVTTALGQRVMAGQVLVTFENASERAQITQAQGTYQAALASQAQAGTSIGDAAADLRNAQNGAVTAHSAAFSAVNQIFASTIDQYYGDVSSSIPGVRLSGASQTAFLNTERVAFQTILSEWRQESTSLTAASSNLERALETRIATLNRLIVMIDSFATILPQQPTNTGTSLETWRQQADAMVQARNSVIQLRTSLETARTGLAGAQSALTRADIGANTSQTSLSAAQVTQALGALQAAQANFNRTVVRAPIAGTVTALTVRVGDTVTPQALVVEIINEAAIEVVTFINQTDRVQFTVGDDVGFRPAGTGTITAIAERIDERTGKIEMRIASNEATLTPGDTVRIVPPASPRAASTSTEATPLTLPLTAIRFVGDTAHIMVVVDEHIALQPIAIGAIRGNRVTVTGGVTDDTVLVADARGKQVGQPVTVVTAN